MLLAHGPHFVYLAGLEELNKEQKTITQVNLSVKGRVGPNTEMHSNNFFN